MAHVHDNPVKLPVIDDERLKIGMREMPPSAFEDLGKAGTVVAFVDHLSGAARGKTFERVAYLIKIRNLLDGQTAHPRSPIRDQIDKPVRHEPPERFA